jgi:ATP-dependent RNA helicase RhlE
VPILSSINTLRHIALFNLPLHFTIYMTFKELGIIEPILKSLDEQGYTNPTPIQAKAIPILLQGQDLLGCAQTGTGKTAAFSIPIIQGILKKNPERAGKPNIKALIVSPTRELALQINDSIKVYAKHTPIKSTVIFGGVKQGQQTKSLQAGVDILVATPGRLLDLMDQGFIRLGHVEYFVLDEADQMLDMGFIHDIKKVIKRIPEKRQSLFFSATMAPAIIELSGQILGDPEKVEIAPETTTAEKVSQELFYVHKSSKPELLIDLINKQNSAATLVFTRTKHGADKVVKMLNKANLTAEAIHGNKSQNARQRALLNFKTGKTKVLIATDIAARGIDISDLSLVVNYELPNVPETYVHRIGRTGRAEASGKAISFCNVDELAYLKDIEKLIRQKIPVIENHGFEGIENEKLAPPKQQGGGGRRGNPSRNSSPKGGRSNAPRGRTTGKSRR